MAFRRGDVVLVPFPFTDLSGDKTRTAVIVSGKIIHQATRDVILAEITSHFSAPLRANSCLLNDWQTAGLKKPSVAKAVLFTLKITRILHRVGTITPPDMASVDKLLLTALEL
jgi:mRNA interferase MazF